MPLTEKETITKHYQLHVQLYFIKPLYFRSGQGSISSHTYRGYRDCCCTDMCKETDDAGRGDYTYCPNVPEDDDDDDDDDYEPYRGDASTIKFTSLLVALITLNTLYIL